MVLISFFINLEIDIFTVILNKSEYTYLLVLFVRLQDIILIITFKYETYFLLTPPFCVRKVLLLVLYSNLKCWVFVSCKGKNIILAEIGLETLVSV